MEAFGALVLGRGSEGRSYEKTQRSYAHIPFLLMAMASASKLATGYPAVRWTALGVSTLVVVPNGINLLDSEANLVEKTLGLSLSLLAIGEVASFTRFASAAAIGQRCIWGARGAFILYLVWQQGEMEGITLLIMSADLVRAAGFDFTTTQVGSSLIGLGQNSLFAYIAIS